jgi:hypothetical protein
LVSGVYFALMDYIASKAEEAGKEHHLNPEP